MKDLLLRKRRPDAVSPYSVHGYPVVPIIAILGAVYTVGNMLQDKPVDAMVAIGITVVTACILLNWTKR